MIDAAHNVGKLVAPVWPAEQIMELAYNTGWQDIVNLSMAVAIAFAECDGYINSYNDNFGPNNKVLSRDVGLWQINIPVSLIGTEAEQDLYDPKTNAQKAFALWKIRGWEPWTSFTKNVVFDDRYAIPASLGALNFVAAKFKSGQNLHPERAKFHTLTTPLVSIPQFRTLYPDAPV